MTFDFKYIHTSLWVQCLIWVTFEIPLDTELENIKSNHNQNQTLHQGWGGQVQKSTYIDASEVIYKYIPSIQLKFLFRVQNYLQICSTEILAKQWQSS